ncbi:MAG: hypothetical protein JWP28_3154 [Phenylobacterium sp.]|jgi:hypothetical protein|nr:hypothetical protein [Phenylobacterium sp.]
MIYVALAFVAAFTSLFTWQSITALRTGVFNAIGWSARRESTPVLYWLILLASSALCIVAGLFFLLLLLSLIVVGPVGG